MCHTLRTTLVVVLAVLLIASAVALAAEVTMSGTVQNVDPDEGRLMLSSEAGNTVELHAPADLLTGLQNGDAVEVKVSGRTATFIRRHEGVPQRPDMGGALQLQPPDGRSKSP